METITPFSWSIEFPSVDLTSLESSYTQNMTEVEFRVRNQLIALSGAIIDEEAFKRSLMQDAEHWYMCPHQEGYSCGIQHTDGYRTGEVLFVKGFQWDVLYMSRNYQ